MMRDVLAVGVAFGVLGVAGELLLGGRRALRQGASSRAADAVVAGTVVLAVVGTTTIQAGGRVSLPLIYGTFALISLLALTRREPAPAASTPAAGRTVDPLRLIALGVWVVLATSSLRDRLLWDAWAFWTLKAKAILAEGTLPSSFRTLGGPYPWTHPEYPLGLPLADWWVFGHVGDFSPAAASFAGSVWLLLLLILFGQSLRSFVPHRWAGAGVLGLAAFWPLTSLAVGGYAEVLMAIALLGATVELTRGVGAGGSIARIALYLTFGAMAKNEGVALAVVGAVVTASAGRRAGLPSIRAFLPLFLPFAAVGPWFVYTRARGAGAEHIGDPPGVAELAGRIPFLLGTFLQLMTTRAWIGVSLLLLVAGWAVWNRRGARGGWGWVLPGGYFAVTQVVYLLTPLDLEWLVINSYFRVLGVLVPAVVLLCLAEIVGDSEHSVSVGSWGAERPSRRFSKAVLNL